MNARNGKAAKRKRRAQRPGVSFIRFVDLKVHDYVCRNRGPLGPRLVDPKVHDYFEGSGSTCAICVYSLPPTIRTTRYSPALTV